MTNDELIALLRAVAQRDLYAARLMAAETRIRGLEAEKEATE